MWIRSQDRTGFVEVTNRIYYINFIDEYQIYVNDFYVGEYNSKERALEVLLEIQNAIIRDEYVSTPIYEMPEE